jgi:hypothetical protein
VLYAADVVTFARKIGVYAGSDEDFSYSDVYDPVTFEGARFCEARVWSFFAPVMGEEFATKVIPPHPLFYSRETLSKVLPSIFITCHNALHQNLLTIWQLAIMPSTRTC